MESLKAKRTGAVSQCAVALLAAFFFTQAEATEPVLALRHAGEPTNKITLVKLQEKLQSHSIRFFNSYANKEKSYEAFAIEDVLDLVYPERKTANQYTAVAFIALDGFEAVISLATLQQKGGFLAFRDLDMAEGWEPVGKKQAAPGPFYLVWTGKGQTAAKGYAWPYQIAELNLLRFEDQYPHVFPEGAQANSPAYRGFEIFRIRCMACHAMDKQGGTIGPDLNAPQSITAYRSKEMIKEFIKNPFQYRYTTMPPHIDLSDEKLEDLYLYLKFQGEKREASL